MAWAQRVSSTVPPPALAAAKAAIIRRAAVQAALHDAYVGRSPPALRLDVAGRGGAGPNPHATAEEVEAARHDTKLAQVLYHDWEAETYDDKWSISYDKRCIDYAAAASTPSCPTSEQRELPYDRALELGCGTGFFLLNLIQSGVARRGSVTDLSPGMVKVATRNGQNPGSRRRRPGRRRRGHPVRRRHLRPGGRARRAAPHSRRRAVAARGGAGAQAGRPVRVRR